MESEEPGREAEHEIYRSIWGDGDDPPATSDAVDGGALPDAEVDSDPLVQELALLAEVEPLLRPLSEAMSQLRKAQRALEAEVGALLKIPWGDARLRKRLRKVVGREPDGPSPEKPEI